MKVINFILILGKPKKEDWSDNDSEKELKIEGEEDVIAQPVKKKSKFYVSLTNNNNIENLIWIKNVFDLAKPKKKAKSESEAEEEEIGSDLEEIEKELVKMKIEETKVEEAKVEEKSKKEKTDNKKTVLYFNLKKIVLWLNTLFKSKWLL